MDPTSQWELCQRIVVYFNLSQVDFNFLLYFLVFKTLIQNKTENGFYNQKEKKNTNK